MTDNNYINERFDRVWDRFTAMEKAQDKADGVFEAYRHTSNEWRGTLSDQASRFVGRQEYTTQHSSLSDKINSLETRLLQSTATVDGRTAGMSTVGTVVVSGIASLVGLISLVSIFITLFHQPAPSVEVQNKLDRLSDQVGQSLPSPPRK